MVLLCSDGKHGTAVVTICVHKFATEASVSREGDGEVHRSFCGASCVCVFVDIGCVLQYDHRKAGEQMRCMGGGT